jgi:hypothetical protein
MILAGQVFTFDFLRSSDSGNIVKFCLVWLLNFGLAEVSPIPGGRPWFYVGYVVALVWASILFVFLKCICVARTWNQFWWVICIVFVYRSWIFPVFAYDDSFVWCLLITCFGSSKLLIVYDLFLYLGRASSRITRLRGPQCLVLQCLVLQCSVLQCLVLQCSVLQCLVLQCQN